MDEELLRLPGSVPHEPAIASWFEARPPGLCALGRPWFAAMRACGDEVRELIHDGCPVACVGDAPFGYVHIFTAHVNVGFFQGAALPDPAELLEGKGKRMRHVKLRPGVAINENALAKLVEHAYAEVKRRVEHG